MLLRNGEHRQFLLKLRKCKADGVDLRQVRNGEQREVLFELRQPETGSGRKMGLRMRNREYRQVLLELRKTKTVKENR